MLQHSEAAVKVRTWGDHQMSQAKKPFPRMPVQDFVIFLVGDPKLNLHLLLLLGGQPKLYWLLWIRDVYVMVSERITT